MSASPRLPMVSATGPGAKFVAGKEDHRHLGVALGVGASGTNGIGLALAGRRMVVVVGDEHCKAAWRELLATTAARIRSAVQAARELYCHRNTVLNRLTRIQRLTGLDVTDTGRWSQVMLALSALRYHGEDLRSE
ncbi:MULTISPECIES: helix-turn-helix domain-containing protein [Actinomycetes]|uniref:helix-turn-helix domain-containing protein n=1 Tax=Actinomycetes TaxID=1760 RepID=UPI0001DEE769|nr:MULTISPECIES: helix-turn-helix domain-containing protein [Actinomycetes]EFL09381.1 predicted protein [Streptomyces sp. AA4]